MGSRSGKHRRNSVETDDKLDLRPKAIMPVPSQSAVQRRLTPLGRLLSAHMAVFGYQK
jgi:hypothetical protein